VVHVTNDDDDYKSCSVVGTLLSDICSSLLLIFELLAFPCFNLAVHAGCHQVDAKKLQKAEAKLKEKLEKRSGSDPKLRPIET